MTGRTLVIVTLIVAASLLLATPAPAFNGFRGDYTTTEACATCHSGTAGIPAVHAEWVETKHAEAGADNQAQRLPYGSVCAGCHTANYDAGKVTPVPTATSTAGVVDWGASPSATALPQANPSASAPFSENFVGCSSCHYGANVGGGLTIYGVDSKDTAHTAPFGLLANAQICGQCHSRYSYTVGTYSVTPIPAPTASATTLIQPQMAVGFPMLGSPAPAPATGWLSYPLSGYLNVPSPGWSPMPDPSATSAGFGRLQTYWQVSGSTTMWAQSGHDGNAQQYPEWASEGHANALKVLTSRSFWAFMPENAKKGCLKCHSADFRILSEAGENPSSTDVQYGVTCVGCHTPHDRGTETGVWDEAFTPQLNTDSIKTVCVQCHNGEIPEGQQAAPGSEVHYPMKEMMAGYGAIGVPQIPSVHKGRCVQCHMPPTTYSRGSIQLGANHTFTIIEPEQAVEASPIPVSTATARATATPIPGGTPVVTTTLTVSQDTMPYSACSTCHNNNVRTSPRPLATATTTPSPSASPVQVRVTITQDVARGDKGMWLQDTITDRQSWTSGQITSLWDELDAAAARLGFTDATTARDTIVAIPEASWTANQRSFLSGFTNVKFIQSEGSLGIHNWSYTLAIVDKAHQQAQAVASDPWTVTLKASKKSVKKNKKVTYSGTVVTSSLVAGTGTVNLERKKGSGSWKKWTTATLTATGTYSKALKMKSKGTFLSLIHI